MFGRRIRPRRPDGFAQPGKDGHVDGRRPGGRKHDWLGCLPVARVPRLVRWDQSSRLGVHVRRSDAPGPRVRAPQPPGSEGRRSVCIFARGLRRLRGFYGWLGVLDLDLGGECRPGPGVHQLPVLVLAFPGHGSSSRLGRRHRRDLVAHVGQRARRPDGGFRPVDHHDSEARPSPCGGYHGSSVHGPRQLPAVQRERYGHIPGDHRRRYADAVGLPRV